VRVRANPARRDVCPGRGRVADPASAVFAVREPASVARISGCDPRKLSSSVDDSCPAGNERGPKGRRERPKKTTPGSPSTWNPLGLSVEPETRSPMTRCRSTHETQRSRVRSTSSRPANTAECDLGSNQALRSQGGPRNRGLTGASCIARDGARACPSSTKGQRWRRSSPEASVVAAATTHRAIACRQANT
jgi:hypothetical protein